MHVNVHSAMWPLRSLGLEPGRSLANARPTPEEVQRSRAEQHAYILEGLARPRDGVRRTTTTERAEAFDRQRAAQ
jgi:hypothetical protein